VVVETTAVVVEPTADVDAPVVGDMLVLDSADTVIEVEAN
jgi:hypothetical protein